MAKRHNNTLYKEMVVKGSGEIYAAMWVLCALLYNVKLNGLLLTIWLTMLTSPKKKNINLTGSLRKHFIITRG